MQLLRRKLSAAYRGKARPVRLPPIYGRQRHRHPDLEAHSRALLHGERVRVRAERQLTASVVVPETAEGFSRRQHAERRGAAVDDGCRGGVRSG